MRRVEVAVVGGGLAGLSTAWALSRSGRSVTVLEQAAPGHLGGSSHGDARIFRYSYPDPFYVGLALEARAAWDRLEGEAGEALLEEIGGLDFGEVPARLNRTALASRGIDSQMLSPAEVAERFPGVRSEDAALYQRGAAVTRADRALACLESLTQKWGGEVLRGSRVEAIEAGEDGARLRLEGGEVIEAQVVVVAAGAWAGPLLASLGIPVKLMVTRERVAFFALPPGLRPPVLVDWEMPLIYALPVPSGELKCGLDHTGIAVHPEGSAPEEDLAPMLSALREFMAEHLPSLDTTGVRTETCLYTNTDDGDFVIDRVGPVVVVSACSGHGFKFGPRVGELTAGLVRGEPALERFRLQRPEAVGSSTGLTAWGAPNSS